MGMPLELRTKPSVQDGIVHTEDTENAIFVEYAPGNGTAYRLMLTNLEQFSVETTQRFGSGNKGCVLVSDINLRHRSMVVGNGTFIHHRYLEEKMGLMRPDAVVIAELLGWLLNMPSTTTEQFAEDHANESA